MAVRDKRRGHHHGSHPHHRPISTRHHAGGRVAGGGDGMAAGAVERDSPSKYPFLWGTQEQRIPVASIPIVMGTKAATVRIPKNGYLNKLLFRFVGSANVTVAGSAGSPSLFNLISSYVLSYNGGFQYRSLDGESMYVADIMRNAGPDFVQASPSWKNYVPTSVTAQTVGFTITDLIGLNTQVNADKYVLAAQARNADITMDITFNSNPNGTFNPNGGIGANTETAAITGTLFVEGLYLLDPPDYDHFEEPNLRKVQQILTDTSYTNVVVGDNTVPIVPVNGPKYLQVAFKAQFNGVGDTQGYTSNVTRVQLKINNGLNRYDISSQALVDENMKQLFRVQCGTIAAPVNAPLPPGWYLLDFLNDASINNAVSQVGRNVISTEKIANLWLIVTVAAGTTLTANNMIKLIKRAELPAVGGTNKLESPNG
jgi:hypothetical protein